ncbi:hypothetical protein Godav_005389 [Gossypium davidsonii]|uniref:RNase H type-1 domain-containing protein n=1 Tax=Gossypium davidsonii TaxID=34287 RepID=A0A7J8T537_GOSDV|nr:hypothetical protein [Gossypium davidsonii]
MDLMLKLNFDTTFHGQSHQSYSGFVVRNAQGQVLGTRMNLVVEGDSRSTIVRIIEMGKARSAIGVYVEN